MKKINLLYAAALVATITTIGCKKEPDAEPTQPATTTSDLNADVLSAFTVNVTQATYNDLSTKALNLSTSVQTFNSATTDDNLTQCKQLWRDCRYSWEQSEGFLFGPAATQSIDPRIDTWPVDYVALDSILSSSATFSESYVNGLDDALRGFHPIEYLLFGTNGNKTASQFTTREKDFLIALTTNLSNLTSQLSQSWNPSVSGNYSVQVSTAGSSGSVYATKRAAFEEMVNAMADICNEVANEKIETPFVAQDPNLEESPFSFNSIADFTNNIRSVQNVYLGKYATDGKGLEDLVRANNLSLDGTIKSKINSAIASLNAITVPFGQAIISQQVQVANAQTAINNLKSVIENDLMTYVQTYTH
ncbi:MAG: peptidase [Bacteroidetes bacterium]|nr:peptidase [Bacteroidota bacterium]